MTDIQPHPDLMLNELLAPFAPSSFVALYEAGGVWYADEMGNVGNNGPAVNLARRIRCCGRWSIQRMVAAQSTLMDSPAFRHLHNAWEAR